MTEPKITIITVVRNAAEHLEQTIKSVINQPYKNLEFIVIDGNSTDDTIAVIKKYEQKLTYWISEPDDGIYDAMNKGWKVTNDDSYILYLGAGDKIIQLPNNLDFNNCNVYFGDATIGDKAVFNAKANFRLKFGNAVHHQALLVPKKLHLAPPFNIKYKIYADFDFNQRLLKRKTPFLKSDQLKSYVMPDGFSQHYETMEWYEIIKNNFGAFYAFLGYTYYQFQIIKKNISKKIFSNPYE